MNLASFHLEPVCRAAHKIFLIALAAGYVLASQAIAHPFTIDQANDAGSSSQGFVIPFSGNEPLGQEFVPTLAGLDVGELRMNDQVLGNGLGADVQVRIRDGSIAGTILGTSGMASVPSNPAGPTSPISIIHFDFGATIALTPGSTYVIEVIHVSGDPIGVFTSTGFGSDSYAAGGLIRGGAPLTDPSLAPADLWFREGLVVSEPATLLLTAMGLLGFGVRRRGVRRYTEALGTP